MEKRGAQGFNFTYSNNTNFNNLTGIWTIGNLSKDQTTKVSVSYDGIEKVTNKEEIFYIVKKSNLYGVLNSNGDTIIYPEYTRIGMDVSAYSRNGVTNGHNLYNELIPVNLNNKWALFNTKGEKITDFIYDGFGSQSKISNTYGVLEIQDYKLLVGRQGEKYDLGRDERSIG